MALYRDLKFNEGSGNLLTDEVAGATLTPENEGHVFNWGFDDINGSRKPFLGISRTNKKPDLSNFNWIGTPYGASFFDGSNNLTWTIAITFRPMINAQGVILNTSALKLLYASTNEIKWGNGGDSMVAAAELIRGKWVTLIFSSSDGNNVNVWFEDMTTAGMLRTFSKGTNGARLTGNWLRINSELAESNAAPTHLSRMTFWTHELNESERVAWQTENGGPSSGYEFKITNYNANALSFSYIWDETDSLESSSYLDAYVLDDRTWYRWRQDGNTCQGCNMGYVKRNLNNIYFHSKTFFPTDINPENGAYYTTKFRIFGLFNNLPNLAGNLFALQLEANMSTNVIVLKEVIYRNTGGTSTINLDGRTIEKGVSNIWDAHIDFANGVIKIWLNGELVLNQTGLTLDIGAEFFGIGPWQGLHLTPVERLVDYTGGTYYEIDQYVGEVPKTTNINQMIKYYN